MAAPNNQKQTARLICIAGMIICGAVVLLSPSGLTTIAAKAAFYLMIGSAIGLVMVR